MKTNTLLGALLLSALPASAAISVLNTGFNAVSGQNTIFTLSSFDPTAGTKLVVTAGGEGNGGIRTITSVTFGGVALTEAISADTDVQAAGIFYLDNPTNTPADIVVTWSGLVNGSGIGALALTGANSGAPAVTGSASGLTHSITSTTNDSFLVSSFVANGGSVGVGGSLTTLYSSTDIGSAVGAAGYQQIPTAGTENPAFTASGSRPTIASAVFAVPEPSTALLGMIGLAALMRRRR